MCVLLFAFERLIFLAPSYSSRDFFLHIVTIKSLLIVIRIRIIPLTSSYRFELSTQDPRLPYTRVQNSTLFSSQDTQFLFACWYFMPHVAKFHSELCLESSEVVLTSANSLWHELSLFLLQIKLFSFSREFFQKFCRPLVLCSWCR